jgi:hypothetical protein
MIASASVFLDFNLPNATTWFYFSLLLSVALFFKFNRLLSIRNVDVLALFLLVPALLLIQEPRERPTVGKKHPAVVVAALVGSGTQPITTPVTGSAELANLTRAAQAELPPPRNPWLGYLLLLCGTVYFLVRAFIDLALVRRPALAPNLNLPGLAWLAGALFICLSAAAFRPVELPAEIPHIVENADSAAKELEAVGRESAVISRVQRAFEARLWASRVLAMLCHLAVVLGLIFIGIWHFQDATAGMAAATFYLILPYTGLYVGQLHHVWPSALLIWAIFAYRRPLISGMLLGCGAGTVFFPVLLLPLWLNFYWRRGGSRFVTGFALIAVCCLAVTGVLLWSENDLGPILGETLTHSDWQPWRVPTSEGFWTGVHWAYRIPVFIAFLTMLVTTVLWPAAKNLAHLMALSAAVLIGIQFWYSDHGGVYVLWYLPLLLLLAFRPNLAERRPALVPPREGPGRFARLLAALGRFLLWLVRPPEKPVRVR